MTTLTLFDSLRQLETKFVSGITRTQGSMFFLEIGNLYLRSGAKRPHGEWHFLFELCHWRISSSDTITVGSDDDSHFIDSVFSQLSLGSIVSADVEAHSNDLCIIFSSGSSLRTLTTSAKATDEEWTQWRLYCPDENVWAVDGGGRAAFRNIHAART